MLAMLIVLFTFGFGGMLLIIFLGARRIEGEFEEKARAAERLRAQAASVPRFFVIAQPAPRTNSLDEALVGELQRYVSTEQMLADEFVSEPSVERLYRGSGRPLTVQ